MRTVFRYLKPFRWNIALQMGIKFAGTLTELFLPWILSHILDEIVPLRRVETIFLWGGAMLLAAAFAWISNIVSNYMAIRISRIFAERLRHNVFERIVHFSSRQVDRFTLPSLSSRLTTDTYYVHQMLDRTQRMGVRAPSLLLGGMIVTFLLEPVLSLVIIGTLPLLAVLVIGVSRRGTRLFGETQTALDRLVRKVQEFMSGVRVIKALSKTEYEKDSFDRVSGAVVRKEQRAGLLMALTSPVINLFLNVGLILVIVLGACRVGAGVIKPGIIVAFLSYFTIILNSIMAVARLFNTISRGVASAERITEVLIEPEDMLAQPEDRRESPYHVEFRNVSFSYNGTQPVLSDINFRLKRGQQLGIIGPTGSGQSTIAGLLLRLYDADSGEIRIDGQAVAGIPTERLYGMFGVAFQNDFLFADTLRENVDFGRGLTQERLETALNHAQAEFVRDKKDGLDYRLSVGGGNLSGGQKQRLLIARALAANPEILILDDSSSALDYKTDALLRRALHEHYRDTTSIIIAQRVSSILNADHILVLEEGRVIGSGTHRELLEACGSYREIYEIQMGEVSA